MLRHNTCTHTHTHSVLNDYDTILIINRQWQKESRQVAVPATGRIKAASPDFVTSPGG